MSALTTSVVSVVVVCSVLVSSVGAVELAPGDLIVTDFNHGDLDGPGSVSKFDPITGVQTLISTGVNLDNPMAVAIDGFGDIIVLDQPGTSGGPAELIRINPADGTQQVISSGGMVNPTGLSLDSAGNFLVSDAGLVWTGGTGGILEIDRTTGVQTVFSSGGFFLGANSLTIDAAGDIFATTGNASNGLTVLKIDPVTGAQTVVSTGTFQTAHSGIAVAASGDIFVNELYYTNGTIKVDPITGTQSWLSTGGYFQDPYGLDFDAAGDLIVADSNWWWPGNIFKVNPTTGAQTLIASGLVDPAGIVVYPIPEPSTFVLLAMGAFGLLAYAWRRRRHLS